MEFSIASRVYRPITQASYRKADSSRATRPAWTLQIKTWTGAWVGWKHRAMFRLGRSVHVINNSHGHVIVMETAAPVAVGLFGLLALLVALLMASQRSIQVIPTGVVLYFTAIAAWASMQTTLCADSQKDHLLIERRLFIWTFRTTYDTHTIDRAYVRKVSRGSNILYLGFKSGKRKRVFESLHSASLRAASVALNSAFHTHHATHVRL